MYPPLWDFFRPTRRRRVNIIRISKTKAFEGIFPWVVWSRWNIFQLGALWRARPIKFARPRRGNNSRGGPRAVGGFSSFFRSPFFGNVFKVPCAANRKRLCLARVTVRRTPTSLLLSRARFIIVTCTPRPAARLPFGVDLSGSSYFPPWSTPSSHNPDPVKLRRIAEFRISATYVCD